MDSRPAPVASPPLTDVLRRHFGYPAFRPGQERLIRAALGGRDALGVLPTGGGKSVTFQIPALVVPGLVLVVSPLISLMEDQVRRAREARIAAAYLNSTLPPARRERVLDEARSGALRLLFVAPERFRVPRFREALRRLRVSLLAIDEAHCISEWGHDFRPDYLRLGAVRAVLDAPVLALTATATPRVRAEIRSVLRLRRPVEVVGSFDRPNLTWHVLRMRDHGRKLSALRTLLAGSALDGSAIVYGPTRRAVEALRRELAARGLPVEAYHAGLAPEVRARVQEAFISGRRPVVVATNAFGMGVDKADVRLVVHYQLPGSLESYYQEAGRGGRDGAPARCVALHARADAHLHRGFVDRGHPPAGRLGRLHGALRGIVGPGRRAPVDLDDLARRLRARRGREEVEAWLGALARVGAVRLYPEEGADRSGGAVPPERSGPPPAMSGGAPREGSRAASGGTREAADVSKYVVVGLHGGRADLARGRRLRTAALERLRGVERFARARGCRRRRLLAYFGEEKAERRCGGCDRCLGAADPVRRRVEAAGA